MNDEKQSLTPAYFADVYRNSADPWDFETSEYEHQKYRQTLHALPKARYRSAFEIGASIGVLTEQLARRCDRLLAVDVSEAALEKARARCRDLPHVEFRLMRVPEEFPDRTFDLILISEVGYYLAPVDWRRAIDLIAAHLAPGADAVLVHWTPFVPDYPQTGDQVHDLFAESVAGKMRRAGEFRHEQYRLDVWTKI